MKKLNNMAQVMESSIKAAQKLGATAVELSMSSGSGYNVDVRAGAIEKLEYQNDQHFSISVYFDKRNGRSNTSDLSQYSIDNAILAACDIAKFTEADEYNGLADHKNLAFDYQDVDVYFPWAKSVDLSIQSAIECEAYALSLSSQITKSKGVSVNTYDGKSVYANSNGFVGNYAYTHHSVSCGLIAGLDAMQTGFEYSSVRDARDLLSFESLAESAVQKTVAKLNSRSVKTGKYPILFNARAAKSLYGMILSALSGDSLYRHASFLCDSLGQLKFSNKLNISEHPFLSKGMGSVPFDGEGVRIIDKVIIENGVVASYLLDTYSANKLNMQTTGNAGGAFNPVVRDTNHNFSELLQLMGTGLIVTDMMGHGANGITGDYSRGASGFWVENGVIVYPVDEVTIAGNIINMLSDIIAIGNDFDLNSNIRCGSLLIESMMVSGN